MIIDEGVHVGLFLLLLNWLFLFRLGNPSLMLRVLSSGGFVVQYMALVSIVVAVLAALAELNLARCLHLLHGHFLR